MVDLQQKGSGFVSGIVAMFHSAVDTLDEYLSVIDEQQIRGDKANRLLLLLVE